MNFSREIWPHLGEESREVLPGLQGDGAEQRVAFSLDFWPFWSNHVWQPGLEEIKYYDFRQELGHWDSLRKWDSMDDRKISAANTTEGDFLLGFYCGKCDA